ncbi:MAG: HD domain-containing protein [Phycisphaerae bacterium]|nr:HD domain-containing protein [Phycisphaerae bacterium]
MLEFTDMLYGVVRLPDWIRPFVRIPEFVRLRGVRLSNVDSFQFKDLNGPTRWEHCLAVAALAQKCALLRGLSEAESIHLVLAALLHDVATPPFAHTAEYVLEGFDHELESQRLLGGVAEGDSEPDLPVFASQLPQFSRICRKLSRELGLSINPQQVAEMVTGGGELGFLINGTIDLDNADNVTRACRYMGHDVDPAIPFQVADFLAGCSTAPLDLHTCSNESVQQWRYYKDWLYNAFYSCQLEELGRQAFLQHIMRCGIRAGIPRRAMIWNTDDQLLSTIGQADWRSADGRGVPIRELIQRYRLLESPMLVADIGIDKDSWLRALQDAKATGWIELVLESPDFQPMVMVMNHCLDSASFLLI